MSQEKLEAKAKKLSQNGKGELRIATFSSMARHLLSPILMALKKDFPEVTPSIRVADVLVHALEENQADIVFADGKTFGSGEWFPMMEDQYYVVAPPGWFSSRVQVTREELYDYPFIDTDERDLKEYFDFSRFRERTLFKSEDDLSVLNMVKLGHGFTVLPELVLKETLSGLDVIPLYPTMTRTLGFAYQKETLKALGVERFFLSFKR